MPFLAAFDAVDWIVIALGAYAYFDPPSALDSSSSSSSSSSIGQTVETAANDTLAFLVALGCIFAGGKIAKVW